MPTNFLDMFSQEVAVLPSVGQFMLILLAQVAFGIMVSLTYIFTSSRRERQPSQSFAVTLVLLPAIVTVVIMMVGSNFASALSLGGAFTIIRFRSVPGDPKDILYVLFCMAIGLTAGMFYLLYAVMVTLLFCVVTILLHIFRFSVPSRSRHILRITIPEDFNYQGVFEDILKKYSLTFSTRRVRTTDLGSLYEVSFTLTMPDGVNEKSMIDEIRTLNGNLPVVLMVEDQTKSSNGPY